jgi:hypothetical protein
MRLFSKVKQILKGLQFKTPSKKEVGADLNSYKQMLQQAHERIARMERNYLVLLKRVLEMDGVQLIVNSRSRSMTQTVMQTNNDDNKGLNEIKPTIH